LRTLGTILKWVILLPILAAMLALAVANGQDVTVRLNPFNADDPILRVDLPLYQLAFILFALGVLVGGLVAWTGQMKQRRRLRARREMDALFESRAERAAERAPAEPSDVAGFLPRPERS
jgi:Lipopolysaccharide assembly protein A domain